MNRVEDERLVTGRGRFTADLAPGDSLFAVFVRSPHAHARVLSISAEDALANPDVVAFVDAAALARLGYGAIPETNTVPPSPESLFNPVPWTVLADECVHFVGQPLGLVIARTRLAAQDAADSVFVEYESLDAVIGVDAALADQAVQLHPGAPGNVAARYCVGDRDSVGQAMAQAAHIVEARLQIPRVVVAPMEPRSAIAAYDPASDRYTLTAPSQGVGLLRKHVARTLNIAPERLRVLTEDVGGAFGARCWCYPEYAALLAAARLTGRTVCWTSTRLEAMTNDTQARAVSIAARLALDEEGRFLAVEVENRTDLGAFNTSNSAFISSNNFVRSLVGPYATPRIFARVTCALTNAAPVSAYRGAGRPEGNYVMERLIDLAARRCGFDRVALRRMNMIPASAMPYRNALGFAYDSGDFPGILDFALGKADLPDFERRRRAAAVEGRLLGLGLGCFVEPAGGPPQETLHLRFGEGRRIFVDSGGQSLGTSHATVFRALAARLLDLDEADCELRQGDSDRNGEGSGTLASRSAVANGQAMAEAAGLLLDKARRLAALLLQEPGDDLSYRRGAFETADGARTIDLFELDAVSRQGARLPDDLGGGLDTRADIEAKPTFPNGCHIAEISIDRETGRVEMRRYVSVDDCGNVLNHAVIAGQQHGGIAQAIGEALAEQVHYDPGSGQIITGSFMDYGMLRACDAPAYETYERATVCTTNPLGLKGGGESGMTGGLSAVMNAVCDALAAAGVDHIDMPCTPNKVWSALQAAG